MAARSAGTRPTRWSGAMTRRRLASRPHTWSGLASSSVHTARRLGSLASHAATTKDLYLRQSSPDGRGDTWNGPRPTRSQSESASSSHVVSHLTSARPWSCSCWMARNDLCTGTARPGRHGPDRIAGPACPWVSVPVRRHNAVNVQNPDWPLISQRTCSARTLGHSESSPPAAPPPSSGPLLVPRASSVSLSAPAAPSGSRSVLSRSSACGPAGSAESSAST